MNQLMNPPPIYYNKLIKFISPFSGEKFQIELSGEEKEIRDLLGTILHTNPLNIKGLRDSFGNYHTISSLLKNPNINSNLGEIFSIVLEDIGNNYQQSSYKITPQPLTELTPNYSSLCFSSNFNNLPNFNNYFYNSGEYNNPYIYNKSYSSKYLNYPSIGVFNNYNHHNHYNRYNDFSYGNNSYHNNKNNLTEEKTIESSNSRKGMVKRNYGELLRKLRPIINENIEFGDSNEDERTLLSPDRKYKNLIKSLIYVFSEEKIKILRNLLKMENIGIIKVLNNYEKYRDKTFLVQNLKHLINEYEEKLRKNRIKRRESKSLNSSSSFNVKPTVLKDINYKNNKTKNRVNVSSSDESDINSNNSRKENKSENSNSDSENKEEEEENDSNNSSSNKSNNSNSNNMSQDESENNKENISKNESESKSDTNNNEKKDESGKKIFKENKEESESDKDDSPKTIKREMNLELLNKEVEGLGGLLENIIKIFEKSIDICYLFQFDMKKKGKDQKEKIMKEQLGVTSLKLKEDDINRIKDYYLNIVKEKIIINLNDKEKKFYHKLINQSDRNIRYQFKALLRHDGLDLLKEEIERCVKEKMKEKEDEKKGKVYSFFYGYTNKKDKNIDEEDEIMDDDEEGGFINLQSDDNDDE